MERYVWVVCESRAAKVAWIKDALSGIYFSPRDVVIPGGIHYSYHANGQTHLKVKNRCYVGRKQVTALAKLSSTASAGGFSVEPNGLRWVERSKIKASDIVFNFDPAMRLDLPFLVSLHLSARCNIETLTNRVYSSGPAYAFSSAVFEFKSYPELLGQLVLQFHLDVSAQSGCFEHPS